MMQTSEAYPRKPKRKRTRPKQTRKVSFSNDVQDGAKEEPNAVSEDSPTAREPLKVSKGSEFAGNSEVIDNPEVIEDMKAPEKDGVF